MSSILITICARGGSKGIPGKNIKPLAGRPLIDYTIKIAKLFAEKHNGTVALSTDDDAIRSIATNCGLVSGYQRPETLASDTAGKVDAIKDILLFEEKGLSTTFDYILDLDVTSPLRTLEDLEAAYESFVADEKAQTLFSVNKAGRNPYFNMVEKKENGFYFLVKNSANGPLTRQSAPQVYELNASFYLYRRVFFEQASNKVITEQSVIYEMPHTCFDLDHPIDFDFLEYLIQNNKLDFELS
ncbi:acylneuraminate cytidylyltransferase family protein [Chitinophaga oryziterrae]|uniref:Acylneuraminate cytidylyltransferase family protein n=1 Tax=Chitinophaga oryziterrae TaxID=1031224 RepID=A0A6N8J688_9BACT|nr:acylneuraminate cytidylyltransferase family protein [Chitinophaga oryziterrae]MVT39729.1 acylneuraminate cytidylyltransferase family protein [Chitinophaga oryziterrae]